MPDAVKFEEAEEAARFVLSATTLRPHAAVVLGSGLGAFAGEVADAVRIPYAAIPHFLQPTAEGHAGQLVIGTIADTPIVVLQGRLHFYEGLPIEQVVFPIRALGRMGIRELVLTSAAGGINTELMPGALVVLSDHINLQPASPLRGPNDERFGTRFPDLTNAYDPQLRELALFEGRRLGLAMGEGVYAAMPGPAYETPAEIRFLRAVGADVVGMSVVPEVIVARHMGLRVLAICSVTNPAAGITRKPITHAEVLAAGRRMEAGMAALLKTILTRLGQR